MRHVKLSQVGNVDTFRARVAAHANEMNAWEAHMARVRAGDAQAYPAPEEHTAIAACIAQGADGQWEPQFDFVDDGPTPEQVLEAKKLKLHQAVLEAEVAAKEEIAPRRKERLRAHQRNDLMREHIKAVESTPAGVAPPARPAALVAYDLNDALVRAVDRHAAELIAQIDDLTSDTVDSWKMPPFPEKAP